MPRPPYRRNADDRSRRRARAAGQGFDQAALDQSVIDKVRSGQHDLLTLGELRHASPYLVQQNLVPRGLLELAMQALFGMLTQGQGTASVQFRGAMVTFYEVDDEHRLGVMIETGGIEKRFEFRADAIPALRIWINEQTIDTQPDGSLEIDGQLWE